MINTLATTRPARIPGPSLAPWPQPARTPAPPVAYADLLTELKVLRKRRGVFAVDIADRVGYLLRGVAGIAPDDGPVEIRKKIARRLTDLADELPADLRVAALAAFAIAPDARQPLYKDRVKLTADRIKRDPRTARRRMDEALVQLAQLATARPGPVEPREDWRLTELLLSLALDQVEPELVEQGRIVAERDGLTRVPVASTHTIAGALTQSIALDRAVFYGGVLHTEPIGAGDRGRTELLLPRPLARGESHEYALRIRIPSARFLVPRLICAPGARCDRVTIRVRFVRDEPAPRVWRIGDVPAELAVDPAGEMHVEFRGVDAGRECGVRWQR